MVEITNNTINKLAMKDLLATFVILLFIFTASCEKQVYTPHRSVDRLAIHGAMKANGVFELTEKDFPEEKAILDTTLFGRYFGIGEMEPDGTMSDYSEPADSIGLQGTIFKGKLSNNIIRFARKDGVKYAYTADSTHVSLTRLSDHHSFIYEKLENPAEFINVRVYPDVGDSFVFGNNTYDQVQGVPQGQTALRRLYLFGTHMGSGYFMDINDSYRIDYTVFKGRDTVDIVSGGPNYDVIGQTVVQEHTFTQWRDSVPINEYGTVPAISLQDVNNGTQNYEINPATDIYGNIYNTFLWSLHVKVYFDKEGLPSEMVGRAFGLGRFESIADGLLTPGILSTEPTHLTTALGAQYWGAYYAVPIE